MTDSTISRVNWNTLFAGGGVMLTIIGGSGWLAMQAIVLPMKAQLDGMASQLNQYQSGHEHTMTCEREVTDLKIRAATAAADLKFVEIETQFRAADQSRNVQFASQQRMDSMLWEKTFPGSRYPSDALYYPNISK